MDTGGNRKCPYLGSVYTYIKWLMFLKSKIQVLFEKHTKEIKEDISIVKLNISKLHKAVITWNKSIITHPYIRYSKSSILCILTCMMPE